MTATAVKYLAKAGVHDGDLQRCRKFNDLGCGSLAEIAARSWFCDRCNICFDPDPNQMIKSMERDMGLNRNSSAGADIDQKEYVDALESLIRQFKNEATSGKHFIP